VTAEEPRTADSYQFEADAVCVPLISSTGHGRASIKRIHFASGKFALANLLAAVQPLDPDVLDAKFLYLVLDGQKEGLASLMKGAAHVSMKIDDLAEFQIPLPPIEVQREIVAEIEGYRRVIDGARAVLDNYRPRIPVDPSWPLVELGEMCALNPRKSEIGDLDASTEVSFVPMSDIGQNEMYFDAKSVKRLDEVVGSYTYFRNGDVLLAKVTPCFENGKAGIARHLMNGIGFGSSEFYVLRPNDSTLSEWIFLCITTDSFRSWAAAQMTGTGGLQRVPRSVLESYKIPLPPLPVQQQIVAEIEAERALVEANRELIARFERKIEAVIARVWGDEAGAEEAAESAAPISLPAHSDAAG
jgi:restriction endonuclease S subunit